MLHYQSCSFIARLDAAHLLAINLERELHHRRLRRHRKVIVDFVVISQPGCLHLPLEKAAIHPGQVGRQRAINLCHAGLGILDRLQRLALHELVGEDEGLLEIVLVHRTVKGQRDFLIALEVVALVDVPRHLRAVSKLGVPGLQRFPHLRGRTFITRGAPVKGCGKVGCPTSAPSYGECAATP